MRLLPATICPCLAPLAVIVAVGHWLSACQNDKVCVEGDDSALCDPDRINTRGWEDSPFMTADGQQLYFMYSPYNFMPIFRLGLPELRGPEREGHVPRDNPFDDAAVYVATRLPEGGWSPPAYLPINDNGTTCCLMTNDGARFWYQKGADGRGTEIVSADLADDGAVGRTVFHTDASSPGLEDNPHASVDDQVVWFTSDRDGGAGGKDLWVSRRGDDGGLGAARNVSSLNTAEDEDQIWVRPDGRVAFFNRGGRIFRSTREDPGDDLTADTWGPATEVLFDGESIEGAEASLTADEERLVFARVDRDIDDITIVEALRTGDGAYSAPTPVD